MTRWNPSIALTCLLVVLFLVANGCSDDTSKTETQKAQTAAATSIEGFADMSGNIDIAGGTAHIPVMEKAARIIMTAHPDVTITIAGGGSGVGARKVGEGLVDIGNTGRPLSDDEVKNFGLVTHPFAVDGVCAVIHPDNPVTDLTSGQLQDAFAGRITNWKDLGGPDHPIHLFTRDEASGTRKVFWKKALAKGDVASTANVVASNGAMKTAIAGDLNALGYVSVGHLDKRIKAPRLDGIAVTQENAANGKYPVTRKLYMNTKGAPNALVGAFIKFIKSNAGAEIVTESGYIPLAAEPATETQ